MIEVAQGTYSDVHTISALSSATFTATQIVAITKDVSLQGGYTTADWTTPDPVAQPTILDAGGRGRVIVISGTIAPTLTGFRLTGGNAQGLGGMYWGGAGGGLYIRNAAPIIDRNQIYSNTSPWYGGGLYLYNSTATVSDNLITDNAAQRRGGGIYVDGGAPLLRGNRFIDNAAGLEGGGVCSYWSRITLSANLFTQNDGGTWGGGLYLYGQGNTLDGNLFEGNRAAAGGGIYLQYEYGNVPVLANTALVGNEAAEGSGIWFGGDQYSWPRIVSALHTTLSANGGGGAGIFVGEYATLALTNTIIAGHSVGISVTAGSTATLAATLWHANDLDRSGAGNLSHLYDYSSDPTFAPDGYHLMLGSAAIDRGVDTALATDIDGDLRSRGAGADLGADEFRLVLYLPLVRGNRP